MSNNFWSHLTALYIVAESVMICRNIKEDSLPPGINQAIVGQIKANWSEDTASELWECLDWYSVFLEFIKARDYVAEIKLVKKEDEQIIDTIKEIMSSCRDDCSDDKIQLKMFFVRADNEQLKKLTDALKSFLEISIKPAEDN